MVTITKKLAVTMYKGIIKALAWFIIAMATYMVAYSLFTLITA